MADEYIRKEDAVKECGDWYVEEGTEEGFIGTVSQMFDMFSPADVAPVRYGRWIKEYRAKGQVANMCTECGGETGRVSKFCPNCGAKMDREE